MGGGNYYTKCYIGTPEGLKTMNGFLILREKIFIPFIVNADKFKTGPNPKNYCTIDKHYENIRSEMRKIFEYLKLAA